MDESGLVAELLIPPQSFKRENYTSYLYCPYSRKIKRRVYLYTTFAYALWVNLESDTSVVCFNERVKKMQIPTANGRYKTIAPNFVSIDKSRSLTVHVLKTINPSDDESGEQIKWDVWAKANGFIFTEWDQKTIKSNSNEHQNLKRLLRFVSAPGLFTDLMLEKLIVEEVASTTRINLHNLLDRFTDIDHSKLELSISRLIVDRVIASDIDIKPLSMATELWINHDLEKK